MTEISNFQKRNGCSACKHAAHEDPEGKSASSYGASFWCNEFKKAVQTKDGTTCLKWEYED